MKHKYLTLVVFFVVASILGVVYGLINLREYQDRKWLDQNFVVLLTMTIDPAGTIKTKRSDIDDRINDYRRSLRRWAQLPYRVIAIESSGFGNPFADILEHAKNITYISKKLPHEPNRGKGYGEAQAIRYAFKNFIINEDKYVMKVTGRYAPIHDLSQVTELLRSKQPAVLLRDRPYHGHWYVGKRNFNLEFSESCILSCDESIGPEHEFDEHLYQVSLNYTALRINLSIPVLPTFRGSGNDPAFSM